MPSLSIGCFHEHLPTVAPECAVVAIDVIRASTTAVTAVAAGQRLYPAGSIEAAVRLAADLDRPLLAGELGGVQPYGFDMQNSPAEMEGLQGSYRPIILLSTSGTRLMMEAAGRGVCHVSCLRNAGAEARRLAQAGTHALILGADSRGDFREEDQLCAARIGRVLVECGYSVADRLTEEVLERWGDAPDDAFLEGRSARYLRETSQERDLEFVLAHVEDLTSVFVIEDRQVREIPGPSPR
ncbi:MAG: 2-phosphosulfolactate phosphatase [Actinobacteria bacterium]|nr:MAG: 2-phosphosulfolactate phosphatase [Actinomycetota bacterium]